MWYVLYDPHNGDDKLKDSIRRHVSEDILDGAFIFTYERMKRYGGQWHTEILPMSPHYIFLESRNMSQLSKELEQYRKIVRVLEDKEILWSIYPEEEEFLRSLCGENHHLSMSRGYVKDGMTHITHGPLFGMERRIRKIDRHKRIARIEAPLKHISDSLLAGLEIVSKA